MSERRSVLRVVAGRYRKASKRRKARFWMNWLRSRVITDGTRWGYWALMERSSRWAGDQGSWAI